MNNKVTNLEEKATLASDDKLLSEIDSPAAAARAFALRELAGRVDRNVSLAAVVEKNLNDELNRRTLLRGNISVSHFALSGLSHSSSHIAAELKDRFISQLSEVERRDVISFLGIKSGERKGTREAA